MTEDNERRQRILQLATHLFVRHGYRRTTLEDIAKRLGIGKSALYYYFNNKEHLLLETTRMVGSRIIELIRTAISQAEDPVEQLDLYLVTIGKALSDVFEEYKPTPDAMSDLPSSVQDVWRECMTEEVTILGGVLERGRRSGVFRITSPDLVATAVVAGLHAFHFYRYELQDSHPKEDVQKELMSLLMYGLFRGAREQESS